MRAWIGLLLLSGCATPLADPDRFSSDASVCDLDVPQQIFLPRCARNGCHVPADPRAGLEFVSGDLGQRLLDAASTTCIERRLIVPGPSWEDSFILTRLSPDPHCGEDAIDRMPLVGGTLSDHEMDCVRHWVHELAGNE